MKKGLIVLVMLLGLIITTSHSSVYADEVNKVYTKHENRYTYYTGSYGNYIRRDYFYYETTEWVTDGTVRTFEGSCPNGWAFVPDPGGGITPFRIEEPNGNGNSSDDIDYNYLLLSYIQCEKIGSGYYITQSGETWEEVYTGTKYWGGIPANEKITFTYDRGIGFSEVKMTLVEGEVLLVFNDSNAFVSGIDRYTHYERNQYNLVFPLSHSTFLVTHAEQYNCDEANSYYHKIALYNGDTSNNENVKYTCPLEGTDSSYEVVYSISSDYLEVSPLVYGTFNYIDSSITKDGHSYYDVYPYLIWGNNLDDNSEVKERFIWHKNNAWYSVSKTLYKYRGQLLYDNPYALYGISDSTIHEINILNSIIYNIN